MPGQTFLNRVAGYELDPNGVHRERVTFIPTDEILFCFTAGAFSNRRIVISASWGQARVFRPGLVYVRTVKGLFATRFRTLARLASRLDHNNFDAIHQSVVVSFPKIINAEFKTRLKQVAVGVNGSIEHLTVARRFLRRVRDRLGL